MTKPPTIIEQFIQGLISPCRAIKFSDRNRSSRYVMKKGPVYLDYNGTTPLHPDVIDIMVKYLKSDFGNPSSPHYFGKESQKATMKAREQVAALINSKPEDIIFTSGGTESNNHAVTGAVELFRGKGNHIITSSIEHPAILEVCRFLRNKNYETTFLPVDGTGMVNPEDVKKSIRGNTILITVMHSNNELGTIQPVKEISEIASEYGICMHTDAAQSCGKVDLDSKKLGIDMLTVAAHKLYGPKGVGALYVREGIEIGKFMHGAGQEKGRRAGTENVSGIAGLGKACEIAKKNLKKNSRHMKAMRERLYTGFFERLDDIRLNGHPELRLPNTLSLSFKGVEASRILETIGPVVAVSAGAACHSGSVEISHVLREIGLPEEWAMGTLRFSTGTMTTEEEVDLAIEAVSETVKRLRNL
jgi:cysteine desulfurase